MTIYALDEHQPVLPEAGRFWIAPGAHVVGRVRIGTDVGIWFGAVIRADNDTIEIGERTNIQEGALLHADPGFPIRIGAGCTIGHHAIVHGCTIGPSTLIGMGATILNGAKIGANCLVGANALVTEGKEFADGTLIVGSPAKALRPLDPQAIENIRKDVAGYVAKWQRYAKELKPIG
jgi:carbonic anhydrase/acetyltransferase-like protein (isoleucine patch superfamily)